MINNCSDGQVTGHPLWLSCLFAGIYFFGKLILQVF